MRKCGIFQDYKDNIYVCMYVYFIQLRLRPWCDVE